MSARCCREGLMKTCSFDSIRLLRPSTLPSQVQAEKDTILLGQIANQPTKRQGQLFDEGWCCDDLLVFRQRRLLIDVDHFEVVMAAKVLFANCPDARNSFCGAWSHSGDVEPENKRLILGCQRFFKLSRDVKFLIRLFHLTSNRAWRSCKPTRVRSVSRRSPTIFRRGSGSLRTNVGIATIWSPAASWGFRVRSITSIV